MTNPNAISDPKRIVVELPMTVEEARQVVWIGKYAPHEPMGKILDSKELSISDLGWAVQNAYNPKVKAAAFTLLADSLGKPAALEATKRFGPQVFEGSDYLTEKREDSLALALGLSGFLFASLISMILAVLQDFKRLSTMSTTLRFVAGVAVILFVWTFVSRVLTIKKEVEKYRSFRSGKEGEDAVVERLRTTLDNQWTIFRNIQLPNHNDDLDVVLVGPGGVWVLEIKAYSGTVRVENQIWEHQVKGGWKRLGGNPSKQAVRNSANLNDFLKRQGLERWVEKAIVMAKPQPISNFETSDVPVWLLPQVEDKVTSLSTRYSPTEKEISQIVDLLKGLAEKAKR